MAASELPEDQFTQDFRTQRRNYGDGDTRIGDHDRLWYDGRTKTIRVYDGTEGGIIVAGVDYIDGNLDLDSYVTEDELAAFGYATTAYVDALVGDSTDHVTDAELTTALSSYATIEYANALLEDSSAPVSNADLDAAVAGLATEAYVDASVPDLDPYATIAYVDLQVSPDLSSYATISYVDTLYGDSTDHVTDAELASAISDMATQTWVTGQSYLTAHQDISGKADITYVDIEITTAIDNLVNGAPGTLDTLNELATALTANDADDDSTATWLQGMIDTNATAIAGKADINHTHDYLIGDVYSDDSTLLVDATNAKIVGDVETASLRTTETGIHLGSQSGETTPGANSVSIGLEAGQNNQGAAAVAIGRGAGETNQADRSIVINATNVALQNTTEDSLVIKPIRAVAGTSILQYNNTTGEITHSSTDIITSDMIAENAVGNSELGLDAVENENIQDDAVNQAKLAHDINVSHFTNDANYMVENTNTINDLNIRLYTRPVSAPGAYDEPTDKSMLIYDEDATDGNFFIYNSSKNIVKQALEIDGNSDGKFLKWDNGTDSFVWEATTVADQYRIISDDTKVEVVDASAGGVVEIHTAGTHRWTATELGHLIPNGNALYDIGNAENKVRHFYLSDNSIYMGDNEVPIGLAADKLTVGGHHVHESSYSVADGSIDITKSNHFVTAPQTYTLLNGTYTGQELKFWRTAGTGNVDITVTSISYVNAGNAVVTGTDVTWRLGDANVGMYSCIWTGTHWHWANGQLAA